MPIKKRKRYTKHKVIFKVWGSTGKFPRAQFIAHVPVRDDGYAIIGGQAWPARELGLKAAPYVVDITNDEWVDFTADEFKAALGAKIDDD